MHGEADILQHRVEVPALDRRIGQAQGNGFEVIRMNR